MKKARYLIGIPVLIFLWHLLVCLPSADHPDLSINPLTDVATVKMAGPGAVGITDPAAVSAFRTARDFTGIPTAERSLNLAARKWFDIYAMIVPFKVEIIDK